MRDPGQPQMIDPATSYLARVRQVALATKVAAGVVLLAGLLVTAGFYLQYSHSADALGSARAEASTAQKKYDAAAAAESVAASNVDSAKAAYEAQQRESLDLFGTVGMPNDAMLAAMTNTRNALADADTTLSDATTTRNGTAMAMHVSEAYTAQASSQLLLAAIFSAAAVVAAALIALLASLSASKARAMVALSGGSSIPTVDD